MQFYTKMPLTVTWYLTRRCNLKCPFCYFYGDSKNEPLDLIATAVLPELERLRPFFVGLIGGEILLCKSLLDIIARLNSIGIKVNLASNGTLLTETLAKQLRTLDIGTVQISLDGHCPELNDSIRGKGTFEKIERSVRLLVDQGFSVTLSPLICKNNIDHLCDLVRLAERWGVKRIGFNLFVASGLGNRLYHKFAVEAVTLRSAIEKLDKFITSYKPKVEISKPCFANLTAIGTGATGRSFACEAGTRTFTILPNGDISGCGLLQNDREGNVLQRPLYDIWTDANAFGRWRNPQPIDGKCSDCHLFKVCRGGCRANAYLCSGTFWAPDPFCWVGEPINAISKAGVAQ